MEKFLRVGMVSSAFGLAKGHPKLALEQPALYAGKLEVDDQQRLVEFERDLPTFAQIGCHFKLIFH